MKDLKWRTGPGPWSDYYKAFKGLLDDLPVEEPPLPPVKIHCSRPESALHAADHLGPWEDPEHEDGAYIDDCLQRGYTVTLTQGNNTIILRGES